VALPTERGVELATTQRVWATDPPHVPVGGRERLVDTGCG
jgi:hypothetical protein